MSLEARTKISEANRNRGPISVETRNKLKARHKGKPLSSAHKEKLSLAMKGKRNRLNKTKKKTDGAGDFLMRA